MEAVQPGETVTDTGTFSVSGGNITINFKELEWKAAGQPFQLDGCNLTLPFKALGGSEGPGTSAWLKRVPPAPNNRRLFFDNTWRGMGMLLHLILQINRCRQSDIRR